VIFGRRPRAAETQKPSAPAPAVAEAPKKKPPPHDYAAEAETLVHYFDFTSDDIASSIAACRAEAGRPPVNRVAWFIPHAASAFAGGIHTVLRFADHLRTAGGIAQVLVVIGAPDAILARARVAEAYPALAEAAELVVLDRIDEVPELGPLDAAIATMWMTTLPVLFLRDVRRKLYFLQDWEAEFYPAGSTSALVEASCRFGFHAICTGMPLAASYRELGGTAECVSYAADPAIFHPRRPPRAAGGPQKLFCYGRPGFPRNCYELAASALRDIKAQLFEKVDIFLAGGEWDPAEHGLRGVARNLGMIAHAEMGDVYRMADVALCLTASRNPSFMLLELMACGTAIVTVRNRHAAWMLGDGEIAFECEASRSELADTVLAALADPALRAARVARGLEVVAARFSDWSPACERVMAAVQGTG
jgi:glycosyltransferase involved in cell wall biosynthesis